MNLHCSIVHLCNAVELWPFFIIQKSATTMSCRGAFAEPRLRRLQRCIFKATKEVSSQWPTSTFQVLVPCCYHRYTTESLHTKKNTKAWGLFASFNTWQPFRRLRSISMNQKKQDGEFDELFSSKVKHENVGFFFMSAHASSTASQAIYVPSSKKKRTSKKRWVTAFIKYISYIIYPNLRDFKYFKYLNQLKCHLPSWSAWSSSSAASAKQQQQRCQPNPYAAHAVVPLWIDHKTSGIVTDLPWLREAQSLEEPS